MLLPTHSPRCGGARRGLVAAMAFAALLVLALVGWLVLGRDSATAPIDPAVAAAPPVQEAAEAPAVRGPEAGPLARTIAVEEAAGAPVGVRLVGDGKLTGSVLDRAGGAPVAGARVELLPLPPAGGEVLRRVLLLSGASSESARRTSAVASALSDAAGGFAFDGVRAGTYYIEARGSWHVPDGIARATVLPSGAGGPVEVWVRPGGRVIGQVLLPDGAPARGARVVLTPGLETLLEKIRSNGLVYIEEKTDAEGLFQIAGAPPGRDYELTILGSGFAITHVGGIEIRLGQDTEVIVRTELGAVVSGTLLSVPGDEQDGDVAPVAGGHVAVVPHGLRHLLFALEILKASHAVSDDKGRYTLRDVPPGEVDLVSIAVGHVAAVGPTVWPGPGATLEAPEFRLERGPSVSGRVVDAEGNPVPDVSVRWNPIDTDNIEFNFSVAPFLARAAEAGFRLPSTDADGRFTAGAFPGSPPYEIDFEKPGWSPAETRWDPTQASGELEVVMHRGGGIEGIVMDSARKEPVETFSVRSSQRIESSLGDPGAFNPFGGGDVFEGTQGRFKLAQMRPGKVTLTVTAKGYRQEVLGELEVVEGQVLRGVIVELDPGATIVGQVIDEAGAPVAGAQVYAVSAGGGGRGRSERGARRGGPPGEEEPPPPPPQAMELERIPAGFREYAAQIGLLGDAVALSGADGRFELASAPIGEVIVHAVHRDFAPGSSAKVEVRAVEKSPPVVVQLEGGSSLFGTVSDRFGRPVPKAIVMVMSPAAFEGNSSGGAVYQDLTGETGDYRIARMLPGSYFLVVTRGDQVLDPASFLGTLNFDLVTVPEGQEVQFDLIDKSVGAARVFGRIRDGTTPVQGGQVIALSFESESMLGVDFKLARVRADGTYEFAGLSPGEYRLDYQSGRRDGPGEARWNVEIPEVPEHRLDLALPEGRIEGRVIARATRDPVARARVVLRSKTASQPAGGLMGQMLSRESASTSEWTDDEGRFRFERLQGGEYELEVAPRQDGSPFAPPKMRTLELRDDQVLDDLTIELEPALRLEGRVLDDAGAPVSGASVRAISTTGIANSVARSEEQGRFVLNGLSEGAWRVSASAEGFATTSIGEVEVKSGAKPLEIALARGIEVRVRVTDGRGAPVSGAAGRLVRKGEAANEADFGRAIQGFFSGSGSSDASGMLDLGRHAPGTYTLRVQRGLVRSEPKEVELGGTAPVEVRVVLR